MNKRLPVLIILFILITSGSSAAWKDTGISIHGFASTGYLRSDHNNFLLASEDGSFEFNEVGINFGVAIAENMRVGLQLYSFDLGDIGNNEIKLDWAFLDYEWKEWLGLRVGKIKTPYGLYNETQDYDMLRTCILLPQNVYYKYRRETDVSTQGMAIYGNIPLSRAGKVKYDIYFGAPSISMDRGVAKELSTHEIEFESARMKYLIGGRLIWLVPVKGLKLGANYTLYDLNFEGETYVDIPLGSGLTAKIPANADYTLDNPYKYIFSIEYDYGELTVAAEYYYMDSGTWLDFDFSEFGVPYQLPVKYSIHTSGFYALLSYRLCSWLELGTYYSVYYQEIDHHKDELLGTMKDLALSARFDINQSWLVKTEVHFMGGAGLLTETDNPDTSYEPKWTLFAIKTTFNF